MHARKRQLARAKKEPYFSERKCWNLDYVLARIIAGGLRSFIRMKRYGIPSAYIDDPEKWSANPDADKMAKAVGKWDEDLKKMLWAFEEIADDYPSDPHSVWFDKAYKEAEAKGETPFDFECNRLVDNLSETPDEIWEEVKAYRAKIHEGLTLFGEHFESLWD